MQRRHLRRWSSCSTVAVREHSTQTLGNHICRKKSTEPKTVRYQAALQKMHAKRRLAEAYRWHDAQMRNLADVHLDLLLARKALGERPLVHSETTKEDRAKIETLSSNLRTLELAERNCEARALESRAALRAIKAAPPEETPP
jgi:hypothetical protein